MMAHFLGTVMACEALHAHPDLGAGQGDQVLKQHVGAEVSGLKLAG